MLEPERTGERKHLRPAMGCSGHKQADAGPGEFSPRDVGVFRPYAHEMPWPDANAEWTRVAKLGGAVIGAYEIRPLAPTRFQVVALRIAPAWRGRGLGRWLLGHAIGTAESQGARAVEAATDSTFYERYGFVRCGDRIAFPLSPE